MTTPFCIVNAAGNSLLLAMIFPRVNFKDEFKDTFVNLIDSATPRKNAHLEPINTTITPADQSFKTSILCSSVGQMLYYL